MDSQRNEPLPSQIVPTDVNTGIDWRDSLSPGIFINLGLTGPRGSVHFRFPRANSGRIAQLVRALH